MSTLTTEEIASFNEFAKGVKAFLDASTGSAKGKNARFFTDRKDFGKVWDAIIGIPTPTTGGDKEDGRPSMLRPVMNNITQLEERGYTKEVYQERYPETKEDGTPHPAAGDLIYKRNGDASFSPHHCVMFTTEAFRANRTEVTGLKGAEPVYCIAWDDVPKDLKQQLAQKFPAISEDKPKFAPVALGLMLRKGSKPKSSQKRHAWAGIEILVGGKYGDQSVVIRGTYKQRRPGLVNRLADNLDIECPSWSTEKTEKESSGTYANVSSALLSQCGF